MPRSSTPTRGTWWQVTTMRSSQADCSPSWTRCRKSGNRAASLVHERAAVPEELDKVVSGDPDVVLDGRARELGVAVSERGEKTRLHRHHLRGPAGEGADIRRGNGRDGGTHHAYEPARIRQLVDPTVERPAGRVDRLQVARLHR